MDNERQQEEERWVLRAIYGDSIIQLDEQNSVDDQTAYLLTVNVEDDPRMASPRLVVLRLFSPATYPSTDIPQTIQHRFQAMFQPGQVVLFEWVQWLRDHIQDHVPATTTVPSLEETSLEVPWVAETVPGERSHRPTVFSSGPLVDRKSIFVAHVSPVTSSHQVNEVMTHLLENKKIARATHNIMAYRINLPGNAILQDNDGDGETAAGGSMSFVISYQHLLIGRLMHLLRVLNVKNVMVVVSRWFGGILLGPDRFKVINNRARKALDDCGYISKMIG